MSGFDSLYTEHSQHYNTIVAICNIVNIDVDFVSPSCLLQGGVWKYAVPFVFCALEATPGFFLRAEPVHALKTIYRIVLQIRLRLLPAVDHPADSIRLQRIPVGGGLALVPPNQATVVRSLPHAVHVHE